MGMAALHPERREDWLGLAAEWIVKTHLEGK